MTALDTYIGVLAESAKRTNQAEDRSRYRDHLANAAILFHLLHIGDLVAFKELVGAEQRSYGNAFLSGDVGSAAEAAFSTLANFAMDL